MATKRTGDEETAGQPLVGVTRDDDDDHVRLLNDGTEVSAIKKRVFLKCCLINLFVVVLAIVIAVVVLMTQIHPMCQSVINAATLVLSNATMYSPTPTTIMMNASLSLNNAGPYDAYVQPFDCDLYDENLVHFATMTMPGMTVVANSPSPLELSNEVTVLNISVFTAAAAKLLQGIPGVWYIKGIATVQPSILGLNVTLNQVRVDTSLPLPATLLRGVEAFNTQIIKGDGDSLLCTADTSFFSSSVLAISHLGQTSFSLHPRLPDGSVSPVVVGMATMQDFNVAKGVNTLKGALINLTKTDDNYAEVSNLISTWARGEDQTLFLKGPLTSGILNGVVVQDLTMRGVEENLITASMIESFYTLTGHESDSGKACSVTTMKNCLRSALMILKNPGPYPLHLKNAGFNVDWTTPSKYRVSLKVLDVVTEKYDCPMVPEKLAFMYTTKGMYSYRDPSMADVDFISIPGNSSTSSVIAGTFQPGQTVPDSKNPKDVCGDVIPGYTCCFASKFAAAACYSLSKGLNYIPSKTTGNATIVAGTFELNMTLQQDALDIFFANNIPEMSIDGVSTSCKDIEFYD